ncbi:secreted RxLR effector protein 161-like [Impatiens glandulifera]|uniref:secreted RxLR effector protein 161-like n=1 Tax=Impatiens glandulifera TaxID=253017 RepID=UPI001FB152A1|nr:secreted RxLR effector protein 161-like [Impatiens glandulifera]
MGSLIYAMVYTRRTCLKRIFRYLRGTSDISLSYCGDSQFLVSGYSDSDYTGDVDSRRSMTGYVFTLGGSVVSWKATLQPTVTLSTTEAEYMALTEATKEGI